MNNWLEFRTQIHNYFETNHKNVSIAWGFFFLLLISCIDYQVYQEISLAFFYLLPVSLITWFVSRKAGFVTSILSAIAWYITNQASPNTEFSFFVPYWNTGVIFIFLFTVSYLLCELRKAHNQEKDLARIDPTTGIANKRLFFELARLEIKKVNRYRHPLTIIYTDIDNFKSFNDAWGRRLGDKFLQTTAETLKNSIRETDIIARIGGDEFVILLPGSGYEPAHVVIGRVQKELLNAMQKNKWTATFTIGAVTFIHPPNSVDEMVQRVDHLIYLLKSNGKNQLKHITSL